MRKTYLLVAVLILVAATNLKAQDMNTSSSYQTAVGVKFTPGALTVKHFINDGVALEGIGYFVSYGFRLTGLYEFHHDIEDVEGLKWYIGPGAHVGFYSYQGNSFSSLGVDGVLGLDYKFTGAPIDVSADWQPYFEFGSSYSNGFSSNQGGLAIRYTF